MSMRGSAGDDAASQPRGDHAGRVGDDQLYEHEPVEPIEERPSKRGGRKEKDKEKGKKIWRWVGLGAIVIALGLVLTGGLAAGGYWLVSRPGPNVEARNVLLSPGSGLNAIAAQLEREDFISNRYLFRAAVIATRGERRLKAGEYAIPARASMRDIYAMLREGRVIQHAITFAEGLTSAMIVETLAKSEVLEGEVTPPPEGTLLPETYQVVRGASRQAVLDRMTKAQNDLLDRLWEGRAEGLPFDTREEAIILASIVEKETGVPEERKRVAAVFVNRLKRGMRLESDPTIIYGISQGVPLTNARGERRTIRRSELDNPDNLYNTYRIDGLPPGPICNPGADSIAAVLNPAETNDLFFVADGTGGHVFAATLAEHNRNVAAWRRIERERLAAED
jgi:UPF0755 protein